MISIGHHRDQLTILPVMLMMNASSSGTWRSYRWCRRTRWRHWAERKRTKSNDSRRNRFDMSHFCIDTEQVDNLCIWSCPVEEGIEVFDCPGHRDNKNGHILRLHRHIFDDFVTIGHRHNTSCSLKNLMIEVIFRLRQKMLIKITAVWTIRI